MDISDPRSFAVPRRILYNRPEYRPRKITFCTLHSNRNCAECKKKKVLAQKRRRHRTLGMDLLVNDFHGFNWLDAKMDGYQTLAVSGKSIDTQHDSLPTRGVGFRHKRLFFPDLSVDRGSLVTNQARVYERELRDGKEVLESFEDKGRLPLLDSKQSFQMAPSSEIQVLESSDKKKRRIKVVLPRIV